MVDLLKRCAIVAGEYPRDVACAGEAVTRNQYGRWSEAYCGIHAEPGDIILSSGRTLDVIVTNSGMRTL